jgi:dCMP deaminase
MKTDKWDQYFLDMCLLNASMSKDPSTQVGAVIVGPDMEVRSTGFNGFARGIEDTDERLNNRDMKLKLVVHAEMNAVLAAARVGIPVKGCSIYLLATNKFGKHWGGAPCVRCTVELIQAGISEVVSYPFKDVPSHWTDDIKMARGLLEEAGVKYREIACL